MMKYPVVILVAVLLASPTPAAQESAESSECRCIETRAVQSLCRAASRGKSANPVRSPQELIARRAIQDRIDASIAADQAKDLEAAVRHLTPDTTLMTLDGKLLEYPAIEELIRRHHDYILKVSDDTRVRVECIFLDGPRATVLTNQHLVRFEPDRKDGSPHEVITNMIHREKWLLTEGDWYLSHIEELFQGPSFLNGEPHEF